MTLITCQASKQRGMLSSLCRCVADDDDCTVYDPLVGSEDFTSNRYTVATEVCDFLNKNAFKY